MTTWNEVTVLELANGQRERFNDGDWIESPYITDSGSRLLQTGNVGVGRLLDRGTRRYVSDETFRELRCKEVVPGDVLICRLADPAGRACLVQDIGEKRMLTSVDVTIYRPDRRKADRRFLVQLFSTPEWFQEVSDRCGGSTRTRISRSQLGKIELRIPHVEEQRRIADALTDADDLVAALERMIAKKQAIKQGMMRQLLTGKIRLPSFTEPWNNVQLGDVASLDPEALSAGTSTRVLLDYISLEDVRRGELLGYTRVPFGSAPSRARRLIREADVLFGTVRPNLQSHTIYEGGLKRPIASTGFAVVRADAARSDPLFVFYLLMSDLTTVQVDRMIAGSNYPAISSGDVRRLTFAVPPLDEQRAIGSALADCDRELSVLRHRLVKAHAVKTGMMQELLTGRARLPVEGVAA